MPYTYLNQAMKSGEKVDQNLCIPTTLLINKDVQPTAQSLRIAAQDRKEWSKIVDACKPRLFSAE